MTQPTASTWGFYGIDQKIVESTVTIQISASTISFQCARSVSWTDARIASVFANAIRNRSYLDMKPNSSCQHGQDMGPCGNRRGYLSECRCEVLNRVTHPEIRASYEDQVIRTIFSLLPPHPFHFKLAIFCSGGLLGEQVLLFRLLDQLKNAKGILELFFIDCCYKEAIQKAHLHTSFEEAVGHEKTIAQFLEEMAQSLPSNIILQGTFFSSDKTYVEMAQNDFNFKHHLLIGADIEGANEVMGEIGKEAGWGLAKPITLVKITEPAICELDSRGNLNNCYNPLRAIIPSPRLSTQVIQAKKNNFWPIAGGVAICVIAASILWALNRAAKSHHTLRRG